MTTLRRSAAARLRSGPRGGFTLLEVMIAMAVAITSLLGYLGSLSASANLQRETQHYGQASRVIQEVHARISNGDLDARVAELQAAPTFTSGDISVEVQFPEAQLDELLGGPVPAGWRYRDLDGDGEVELDPAATVEATLVPITVLTTWAGGASRASFVVTKR